MRIDHRDAGLQELNLGISQFGESRRPSTEAFATDAVALLGRCELRACRQDICLGSAGLTPDLTYVEIHLFPSGVVLRYDLCALSLKPVDRGTCNEGCG